MTAKASDCTQVNGGTDANLIIDGSVSGSIFVNSDVIRSSINLGNGGTIGDGIDVTGGTDANLIIDGAVGGGINVDGVMRSSMNLQSGGSTLAVSVNGATDTDLIIDGAVGSGGIFVSNNAIRTSINLKNGGTVEGTLFVLSGSTDTDLIIDGAVGPFGPINVNNAIRTSINVQSGGNVQGGITDSGTSINSTVMVKGNVSSINMQGINSAITILNGGIIGDLPCGSSKEVESSATDATIIIESGGEAVCPIIVFGPGATLEVKEGAKTDIIRVIPDGTQTITIAARATVRGIQVCSNGAGTASVLCNGETLEAPSGPLCDNYDQACQAI